MKVTDKRGSITCVLFMMSILVMSLAQPQANAAPMYYTFEGVVTSFRSYHSELDINDFDVVIGETLVKYVFIVDLEADQYTYSNSAGTWYFFYTEIVSGSIINGRDRPPSYTGFNWYTTRGPNLGSITGSKLEVRIHLADWQTPNWRVGDWQVGQQFTSIDAGTFAGSTGGSAVYAYGTVVLTSITSAGNEPPLADAGVNQTVAASSGCSASVTLDGSGSSDPDMDLLSYYWEWNGGSATGEKPTISLPLGTHAITMYVSDGTEEASDTVSITVRDTSPPSIVISATPTVLWPPNKKMRDVRLEILIADSCDANPEILLDAITMNDGQPDDYEIINPRHVKLRSERAGNKQDRIYTLHYTAKDSSGNQATIEVDITVPHDMRNMKHPKHPKQPKHRVRRHR